MTTYARKELPIRRSQVIQIGDDWIGETFKHKNPDGTPVDLTGATITGTMELVDGTKIPLTINRDDEGGSYYPSLPRATTAEFCVQVARFDIDVIDTLDRKTTYWAGPVAIKETV